MKLYSVDSTEDIDRLDLPPQFSPYTRVVGSCNGLVCLANIDCDNICIWNLSLKLYKILHVPNKRSRPYVNVFGSRPYINVFGFGYDSIFNDYKILRILTPDENKGGWFGALKLEAEMYSANADFWKDIQLPETVRSSWHYRHYLKVAFEINGVLYFESVSGILSFDLHNEVFKLYEYPNSLSFF